MTQNDATIQHKPQQLQNPDPCNWQPSMLPLNKPIPGIAMKKENKERKKYTWKEEKWALRMKEKENVTGYKGKKEGK